MQKWEYLWILANKDGVYWSNGNELKKPRMDLMAYLEWAGENGWELVIKEKIGEFVTSMIFKRPKQP